MASPTQNWASWHAPPPPPPPPQLPPAAVPGNGTPFVFRPPTQPTVQDADEEEMTDASSSEGESSDESDGEGEDEPEKPAPDASRPRESGAVPASAQVQANAGVAASPGRPGQGASLDVLTEIRKMIKEELGQMQSPTSPGMTQQASGLAVPNMSVPRPQPPPSTPSQYAFSPGPRPQFGMPWSSIASPPPSPGPGLGLPEELSPLDTKWGVLFDQNSLPTRRWDQILRGLGNYMLHEFMPPKTLVVTPAKMVAFYCQYKLELEPFQFTDLFRTRQGPSPIRLTELYEQLACEYYLVPAKPNSRPTVPGLTLSGWARWMTLVIRAYPNEEAQRLARVFAALPINADSLLDGKPERLPKHISRRLLPERADRQARMLFDRALQTQLKATPLQNSKPSLPDAERRASTSSRPPSPRSRYRPTNLPSPPSSQAGDDVDHHHSSCRRTDWNRDQDNRERSSYRQNSAGHGRTYSGSIPSSSSRAPPPTPLPSSSSSSSSSSSTSDSRRRRPSPSPFPSTTPPSVPGTTPTNTTTNTRHRHFVGAGAGVVVSHGPDRRDRRYSTSTTTTTSKTASPGYLPRSTSDSGVPLSSSRRDRGGRGGESERRQQQQQHREGDKTMYGGRYRERDRERDRGKESEREREKERERERERDVKSRGREKEMMNSSTRRERPGERRSASAAGRYSDGRTGGGSRRRASVVVRDARDERNQTWGEFLAAR
ncbi:hypothetical protein N658DRAFT_506281 [Parathielavia hyrcaniae]|uniref:DUF7514 domain-containing protein n=1 Tax=Parathielavia hyrcaniae TaxID=113614 RepID=A0AAN6T3H8_9PEZI|nr:hypothetical protein N658DRAFT_506281 [Parathielavia hyrcaniae]